MIGRSGSPSTKSTSTSWPMRGRNCVPKPRPAQPSLTRSQALRCESSNGGCANGSPLSSGGSHGKRTRTRPRASAQRSSPLGVAPFGPMTTATCGPRAVCRVATGGGSRKLSWVSSTWLTPMKVLPKSICALARNLVLASVTGVTAAAVGPSLSAALVIRSGSAMIAEIGENTDVTVDTAPATEPTVLAASRRKAPISVCAIAAEMSVSLPSLNGLIPFHTRLMKPAKPLTARPAVASRPCRDSVVTRHFWARVALLEEHPGTLAGAERPVLRLPGGEDDLGLGGRHLMLRHALELFVALERGWEDPMLRASRVMDDIGGGDVVVLVDVRATLKRRLRLQRVELAQKNAPRPGSEDAPIAGDKKAVGRVRGEQPADVVRRVLLLALAQHHPLGLAAQLVNEMIPDPMHRHQSMHERTGCPHRTARCTAASAVAC